MKNGDAIIGLFQGMFDKNIITFNPEWNQETNELDDYLDVRELYKKIKETKDNKQLNRLIAKKELINKDLANYRVSIYRNQLETYYVDYQIINEFKYLKYVNYEDQKKYLYDGDIGFLKYPKEAPNSSAFV